MMITTLMITVLLSYRVVPNLSLVIFTRQVTSAGATFAFIAPVMAYAEVPSAITTTVSNTRVPLENTLLLFRESMKANIDEFYLSIAPNN